MLSSREFATLILVCEAPNDPAFESVVRSATCARRMRRYANIDLITANKVRDCLNRNGIPPRSHNTTIENVTRSELLGRHAQGTLVRL
ncbi:response regulator receiver protein [Burkholderia metallica]|nr:response regulator receiver protein [Burkholderia metallica]